MTQSRWDEERMPKADAIWQLYHENSKSSRFKRSLSEEDLLKWQSQLAPSLVYHSHPAITLPAVRASFPGTLEVALCERATAPVLAREQLPLETVASLLHYAYGITRPVPRNVFPFGYRAVPSGGALYPLEIYFHAACIDGLPPGLYHYEPHDGVVRRVVDGDQTESIAAGLAYPHFAHEASLTIFITAVFERTTTKYGDRGYRFALLEAGHVAQNLALCTAALDLAGATIGGYFDHLIDELLQIDGVYQSTLYLYAVGGRPA